MPTSDARNATINCLRGLSAIAVVLFHLDVGVPHLSAPFHAVARWGWLGVTAFFVISGYCIAHARQRDGLAAFWWRRLLRIYPPFWGSLAVIAAIIVLRKMIAGTNDIAVLPSNFTAIVYTAIGLTSPASAVPGMNWVYWSLTFEIAFYIIAGVVLVGRSAIPVVAFGILSLLLPGWFPFSAWGYFALGIAGYYFSVGRPRDGAIVAAISVAQMAIQGSLPECFAAVATLIMILFPAGVAGSAALAFVRNSGTWSYSLYLLHVPVCCYIGNHLLPRASGPALLPAFLRDLLLLVASVASAAMFYRWVEAPAHELARRWPRRRPKGGPKPTLTMAAAADGPAFSPERQTARP